MLNESWNFPLEALVMAMLQAYPSRARHCAVTLCVRKAEAGRKGVPDEAAAAPALVTAVPHSGEPEQPDNATAVSVCVAVTLV